MFITINHLLDEPLYMQIRSQVIAGIACGDLSAGEALPSVRRLASDLSINLHTVNKAYAVLRDEGYIVVRGRAGAFVAETRGAGSLKEATNDQMDNALRDLAVAWRARGGTLDEFVERAAAQAKRAYEAKGAETEGVGVKSHSSCGD